MLTKLTAHRGYSKRCLENSLEAFDGAVRLGADRIEFDVHCSKDGQLVIHHDYALRAAPLEGALISETQRESLPAEIPLLDEALVLIPDSVALEVELRTPSRTCIESTLKCVEARRPLASIEFTSPHPFVLTALRALRPAAVLGLFVRPFPEWMSFELGLRLVRENLRLAVIDVAHLPCSMLTRELVDAIHGDGRLVHAADCNTREELSRAFELRVDQLSTDELPLAMEVRRAVQGT